MPSPLGKKVDSIPFLLRNKPLKDILLYDSDLYPITLAYKSIDDIFKEMIMRRMV
jgi:hypothetical protein